MWKNFLGKRVRGVGAQGRVPPARSIVEDSEGVIDGGAPAAPRPPTVPPPVYQPFLTERPSAFADPAETATDADASLPSRLDGPGSSADETLVPGADACLLPPTERQHRPIVYQTRPLPSVLMLHTGGTLGMSTKALESRDDLDGAAVFREPAPAAITSRPSSPVSCSSTSSPSSPSFERSPIWR